jgi:hypothetical protein
METLYALSLIYTLVLHGTHSAKPELYSGTDSIDSKRGPPKPPPPIHSAPRKFFVGSFLDTVNIEYTRIINTDMDKAWPSSMNVQYVVIPCKGSQRYVVYLG